MRREDPSKVLLKNTVYPKQAFLIWTKQFREECQINEEAKADYDFMKENIKLKKQLAELQKENDFLKKAAAFFAKEID